MSNVYAYLYKIYRRHFKIDPLRELIKKGLVVGNNFSMLGEAKIDPNHCWHVTIGDDVTLAPRVNIIAHDASTKRHLNYTKIGKITIGDRVFIGACSIILPGVKIGNDVVIGAGSVVARDIPDRVVAAGNPAKVLYPIDEFLIKKREEMKIYPCFGAEYTVEENVTDEMKIEMKKKMKDRYGYVV